MSVPQPGFPSYEWRNVPASRACELYSRGLLCTLSMPTSQLRSRMISTFPCYQEARVSVSRCLFGLAVLRPGRSRYACIAKEEVWLVAVEMDSGQSQLPDRAGVKEGLTNLE